ncbi:hypothetical protein VB834_17345 [Limnoraphis robusta Tam1]|uniref:DUF6884 domain-containing protein n=1 Tax=Limnoraphis robusta CCNP1315 TaxID=3110306 RepID=A0ABU5TZ38_9CYAN|nr:DUF6884 domain-containing protein [Limnoraphis robusta]MEA5495978.1 hypothetical protein [Limnoraphis robusta BA-68 BA1]MEA5520005.1 hypothetical protein [Limnoraphis robusta CCNP1315]MEA5540788.1 hypothetical protein [Limnoraphis robusta Tam1]MEA5544888.1 hypothetical protein [Limnoraphis robusta CCNP1324]
MKSIALVSCVAKKQERTSVAKDLYCSPWFKKAKAYVESQGWQWYILSAKYGLLEPEKLVEPYDQTLNQMPTQVRYEWAEDVFNHICRRFPERGKVIILAGKKYRQYLCPHLEKAGYTIAVPLMGLGIGQQLNWFDNQPVETLNQNE